MYLIWSARSGGWLTSSGTFTSVRADARQFQYEDALAHCIRQRDMYGFEYAALPVPVAFLNSVDRGGDAN